MTSKIPSVLAVMAVFLGSFTLPSAARADAGQAVPHTSAKDQGGVGFCWSYSLSAMIESEAMKQGKAVELSEEYVGFYSMYDTLEKNLPEILKQAGDRPARTIGEWIRHNWIIGLLLSPREGAPNLAEPLEIIKKYGMLPQGAYTFKISKDDPRLEKRVRKFVKSHLSVKSDVIAYQKNLPKLFADFSEAFGQAAPLPTDTFTVEGRTYNATTYLRDYLNFNPDDYAEITVNRREQTQTLQAVQRALNDHSAVELGFTVMGENRKTAIASGHFEASSCPNSLCRTVAGGHAVLIINLETAAPGAKDPLQALIIKNSWGTIGLDENGQPTASASRRGYFTISPDYLDMPWASSLVKTTSRGVWSVLLNKKYL
ncbi:MAG: hypothetical protein H7222_09355 [Methylotenera sp.]|nr:hypothetical protein [Oligoflexia bacterium]